MLGLELLDARVVGVSLDENGRCLARVEVDDHDLSSAAERVLEQLAPPSAPVTSVGVAASAPESAAVAAAIEALAGRYRDALTRRTAAPSGVAAAAAEAWIGAARDVNDVVYFAVADHSSAGIVRGGIPVTGAHGRASAVAWMSLNPVEREDYRKIGCLEAEVAAAGIVRRLIWRIKSGDRSRLQDVVNNDFGAITLNHVLDAARGGDGVSISVVRDTAKYLGMAAANLVVLADPQMLVVGGIMASAADLLLDPVRTDIARRLPKAMADALTIVPAALGSDAAAIGAAHLAAMAFQ